MVRLYRIRTIQPTLGFYEKYLMTKRPNSNCQVRSFAKSIHLKLFGECSAAQHKDSKAEQTRARILEAAFEEIYQHGFQGMRIENVLQKTQLAKGALYHHFPSKKALGYAVVDEVIIAAKKQLLVPLENTEDPIATCNAILMSVSDEISDDEMALGCPLNNLVQEMSGLDDGFNERFDSIYCYWQSTLSAALECGQSNGTVKKSIDTETIAIFIISSINGITGTVKCMQSKKLMTDLHVTLCQYLETLRP